MVESKICFVQKVFLNCVSAALRENIRPISHVLALRRSRHCFSKVGGESTEKEIIQLRRGVVAREYGTYFARGHGALMLTCNQDAINNGLHEFGTFVFADG